MCPSEEEEEEEGSAGKARNSRFSSLHHCTRISPLNVQIMCN